jgi:nucleoside-diphosphate-sugar epimerase
MRIFITGSTGYIGANLALKLANAGHTVHALVRSPENAVQLDHPNITLFKGDILDKASINKAIHSCEVVFHLAAYARVWAQAPATYFEINVDGTKNIMKAALENGVRKMVYTSTAGVIGPSYEQPSTEDTTRIVDFFNEYESSKIISENWALYYQKQGLDIVTVYPPRVYGPGVMSESNAVSKLIDQYISGKWRLMPGDGMRTGCYAYIDDVTDGHIKALEKGRPGERYILGGENVDYHQLFGLIRKHAGVRQRLYNVPMPLMLAFGQVQLLKHRITGKPPLLTPSWVKKYLYDWSLSSDKAIKELGYTITPLDEGIRQTVEWLKNNR